MILEGTYNSRYPLYDATFSGLCKFSMYPHSDRRIITTVEQAFMDKGFSWGYPMTSTSERSRFQSIVTPLG